MRHALRSVLLAAALGWSALFWMGIAKAGTGLPASLDLPEGLMILWVLGAVVAWSLPITMLTALALLLRGN